MSKNDSDFNEIGLAMNDIINSYYNMALDPTNHPEMIKDKTMIQFLAYSLDSDDPEIVNSVLKTIQLLAQNTRNQNTLKSTFGILEAISATIERHDLDESLINLSKSIYGDLQYSVSAYNSKSSVINCTDSHKRKFSSKVYSLHIFGLNQDTRNDLESALLNIRGMISVVLDVEHQRCTIRVVDKVKLDFIIATIADKTTLKARLILRNKLNQEVLMAATDDEVISNEEYQLPEYLPEEESPVKEKALHPFDRFKASAAGLINSATSFLQNSFYW